jgi:hypothetical protein
MGDEATQKNQDLLSIMQEAHPARGIAGKKTFCPFTELGAAAIRSRHQRLREPAEVGATEVLQNRQENQPAFEVFRMREVPPPPRVQEQDREV